MEMIMKKKEIAILAAAAALLFLGGIFAVNTAYAAEDSISVGGETVGTQLRALADTEVTRAFKNHKYGDVGCTVTLPEGYIPSGSIKGMFISERNPLDSSNIYYTVSENPDTEVLNEMLDSDEYKQRMEKKLKEEYGPEASVDTFRYTKEETDGCPSYKVELACQAGDMRMEQLIYIIVADKTYTITYSQSADDERMGEFRKSAGTVQVVFEK